MVGLFTLILGLICLYFLSRIFINKLYTALYKLTRSHQRALYIIALIFLPGTFIHEISHFITALFLLVPVGELTVIPEIVNNGVRLGSVKIGKADIIRDSLIGIAPFLVGTSILLGTISHGISSGLVNDPYFVAFMLYLIFQITHTMFSSKEDLQSVTILAILLLIIITFLIVFSITEPFIFLASLVEQNRLFIEQLALYVFIPIGLEILFILPLRKYRF